MQLGEPNYWGHTPETELIPGLTDFINMRKPYVEPPAGFEIEAINPDAAIATKTRHIPVKYIPSDNALDLAQRELCIAFSHYIPSGQTRCLCGQRELKSKVFEED